MRRIDNFSIKPILLPLSFHEATAEASWLTHDVYQERFGKTHNRIFDTVC